MYYPRKVRARNSPTHTAEASPPAESGGVKRDIASLSAVLDLAGKVIGLTSIIAALLYYFGWARTQALYKHFGVDQTMLGFTAQDYVLRSLVAIWTLLQWIIAIAFVAIWADYFLDRWLRRRSAQNTRRRRLLALACVVLGPLLIVASLAVNMTLEAKNVIIAMFPSLAWTAGLCLLAYGFYVYVKPRLASSGGDHAQAPGSSRLRDLSRISLWLFMGLLVVSLFWVVSIAASEEGKAVAAIDNSGRADVVVYSSSDLGLQAPGIASTQTCQSADKCQYRYAGLKFLVRSGGKYFLLPAKWEESKRLTIVLPDDGSIRVELAPPPTPIPTVPPAKTPRP